MWAFCVQSFGSYGCIVPCGNSGQMKLKNKTRNGWLKETQELRKNGTVYILPEFTQKMCELGPKAFTEYVMQNGKIL